MKTFNIGSNNEFTCLFPAISRGANCFVYEAICNSDIVGERGAKYYAKEYRKNHVFRHPELPVDIDTNHTFRKVFEYTTDSYQYVVQDKADGKILDIETLPVTSFDNEIRIMLSVLNHIESLHNSGWLHLDIKPGNILALTDKHGNISSECMVRFFDYDSLIKTNEANNDDVRISTSHLWAPFELNRSTLHLKCIGEWTDLYMVAMVFYYRITGGKIPCSEEQCFIGKADFSKISVFSDKDLFYGKLNTLLANFFKKAWYTSMSAEKLKSNRFSSVHEMREALAEILDAYARKKLIKRVPIHAVPVYTDAVIGRDTELKQIKQLFDNEENTVVLSSWGGIGKSTIACEFSRRYRKDYRCFWVAFSKTIQDTIASIHFTYDGTEEISEKKDEKSVDEQFKYNIHLLDKLCEDDVLIIDNYDVPGKSLGVLLADNYFKQLCSLNCKILITSRNTLQTNVDPSESNNIISVQPLSQSECLTLLKKYYTRCDETTDEELTRLIKALHSHTLAITLAAKTLQRSLTDLTPAKLVDIINSDGTADSDLPDIEILKDEDAYMGKIIQCVEKLYNAAELNHMEQNVMRYMTLIGEAGIYSSLLLKAASKDTDVTENSILTVTDKGWVQISDDKARTLYIHPIIRAICMRNCNLKADLHERKFQSFFDYLVGEYDNRSFEKAPKTHYNIQLGFIIKAANAIAPGFEYVDNFLHLSSQLTILTIAKKDSDYLDQYKKYIINKAIEILKLYDYEGLNLYMLLLLSKAEISNIDDAERIVGIILNTPMPFSVDSIHFDMSIKRLNGLLLNLSLHYRLERNIYKESEYSQLALLSVCGIFTYDINRDYYFTNLNHITYYVARRLLLYYLLSKDYSNATELCNLLLSFQDKSINYITESDYISRLILEDDLVHEQYEHATTDFYILVANRIIHNNIPIEKLSIEYLTKIAKIVSDNKNIYIRTYSVEDFCMLADFLFYHSDDYEFLSRLFSFVFLLSNIKQVTLVADLYIKAIITNITAFKKNKSIYYLKEAYQIIASIEDAATRREIYKKFFSR